MARAYAGTVMLEGTTLSEGRGTTRPLELFGAPDIDARALMEEMQALAPQWLKGCALRDCWFEPTFHKHVGKLCNGVQIHTEGPGYDHQAFRPWRSRRSPSRRSAVSYPDYPLWRDFPYEYERGRLAIDVINGGPLAAGVGGRSSVRRRRTWMRWRCRTSRLGWMSGGSTCAIEGRWTHDGQRAHGALEPQLTDHLPLNKLITRSLTSLGWFRICLIVASISCPAT